MLATSKSAVRCARASKAKAAWKCLVAGRRHIHIAGVHEILGNSTDAGTQKLVRSIRRIYLHPLQKSRIDQQFFQRLAMRLKHSATCSCNVCRKRFVRLMYIHHYMQFLFFCTPNVTVLSLVYGLKPRNDFSQQDHSHLLLPPEIAKMYSSPPALEGNFPDQDHTCFYTKWFDPKLSAKRHVVWLGANPIMNLWI